MSVPKVAEMAKEIGERWTIRSWVGRLLYRVARAIDRQYGFRRERVWGCGSGGPEDINTYRKFHSLPKSEQEMILKSQKGVLVTGTVENMLGIEDEAQG